MKNNGKKGTILVVVLVCFSLLAVSFIGYQWWITEQKNGVSGDALQEIALEDIIKEDEEEFVKWEIYKNEKFGFEIKYPLDWEVKETHLGVGFSSKDFSWKPRFGYGTKLGIGINSYAEIGAWTDCIFKDKKITIGDLEIDPVIYAYLKEDKSLPTQEECNQLPLGNSYLVDSEFCVDTNKKYLGDYCQEGGENFYYQIGLSCGGEEWEGTEGMNKCSRLFNQIISSFRFIEE